MVGCVEKVERGSWKAFDHRLKQVQLREGIPRARQEEHWKIDVGQMISALGRRLSCGMKREGEKDEGLHAVER